MRKPAGTGFCWPIISFTLVTALPVRVTGAAFLATSGTVVVAIRISLALKLFDYSKCRFRNKPRSRDRSEETDLLVRCQRDLGSRILPAAVTDSEQRDNSTPGLANGAIIIPVRAFPGTGMRGTALPPAQEVESRSSWFGICRGGLCRCRS